MRALPRWLSVFAAFVGVACGLDLQGTGPESGRDSGGTGDGAIVSVNGVASSDGAAGGNGSDSASGNGGGGVVGSDSSGAETVPIESGAGTGAGMDAATSDGVAIAADGSALCGPCSQGQQCDPTLGCVTCTMDSQCPASAPFCVTGSCVQCRANIDCASGTASSCWPGDHACHATCSANQPCPQDNNTRICDGSIGACVGCVTSADCSGSQSVCDPTSQKCVQCASSADCTGGSKQACARNRCVQCATNADCSTAAPFCALGGDSAFQCVQCLENAHCPATAPNCNGGTCNKAGG